jgi:hypothetical protein
VLTTAGFVRHDGQWMLPGEVELLERGGQEQGLLGRQVEALISPEAATREQAVRLLVEAGREAAVPALLPALRDERWQLRAAAARLLGRLGGQEVERSLVVTATVDRVADVRRAAVAGLRSGTHPDAYVPLVKSLAAGERSIRINAVRALGQLDDPRAVGYLVKHIRYSGGGPRAHVYVANQIAYISDYDVEVAQRAAIADPIINYIQEGVVLDAQVVSIQGEGIRIERAVTGRVLGSLTGVQPAPLIEPGSDEEAAAWTRWWREHRHEFEPGGVHYRKP